MPKQTDDSPTASVRPPTAAHGGDGTLSSGSAWMRDRKVRFLYALRSARDLGFGARREFSRARVTTEYQAAYDKPDPLVSICIATYNRGRVMRDRSVQSLLDQTYRNIQIIVVVDACTDETADIMAEVKDPRVTFVNLEKRGDYPAEPYLRWLVAGTQPMNRALALARGDFITHLDDDDEHAPDRIEKLLAFIRKTRADLVYHPFRYELESGAWLINDARSFFIGSVTTSSIFYHNYLASIPWDPEAYRFLEPGDWNRLRKFAFLGAKSVRHPDILLSHHRERNQRS